MAESLGEGKGVEFCWFLSLARAWWFLVGSARSGGEAANSDLAESSACDL